MLVYSDLTQWFDLLGPLIDLVWNSSLVKKNGKQKSSKACSHDHNKGGFAIALGRKLGGILRRGVIKLVNRLVGSMGIHCELTELGNKLGMEKEMKKKRRKRKEGARGRGGGRGRERGGGRRGG